MWTKWPAFFSGTPMLWRQSETAQGLAHFSRIASRQTEKRWTLNGVFGVELADRFLFSNSRYVQNSTGCGGNFPRGVVWTAPPMLEREALLDKIWTASKSWRHFVSFSNIGGAVQIVAHTNMAERGSDATNRGRKPPELASWPREKERVGQGHLANCLFLWFGPGREGLASSCHKNAGRGTRAADLPD